MKKTTGSSKKRSQEEPEQLSTQLGQLFEDEFRDIFWAEKALVEALPKMAKNATSQELVEAIEDHLEETKEHVRRAEEIFSILGKEPRGKQCEAMEGLLEEGKTVMEEATEGVMRDAAIISAAQKVEHYEIASYGTLRTFAQTLGMSDVAQLLEQTLEEEKNCDSLLTELAESIINPQAAAEQEE
jgi:ferritin-like metal-binding protein YciE